MLIYKSLSLLLTVALLAGCDFQSPNDEPDPPRALSESEKALVAADNQFGLYVFQEIVADEEDGNVFISPLSISMALGMALNGAQGETLDEMKRVLAKEGLSEEAVNTSYRDLIDLLTNLDNDVTMNLANSVWYRDGFHVEQPFLDKNQTYFNAEVTSLDFADPSAPATINQWVDNKTSGRIKQIVEQISAETMMYLINATYFKGTWTYQFDPEATVDADFYLQDGSTATVPTMNMSEELAYFQGQNFSAVDIPYGNNQFSMTVLLPHPGQSVDDVAGSLDTGTWAAMIDALSSRQVDLFLPRFTLEYKKKLKDVLRALGMDQAFNPGTSNFAGINPHRDDLYISEVTHKTFLDVNEEGTEAAAVTSVEIGVTSADPNGPVRFEVDRPFILAIREQHTGSIIFMGRILSP